MGACHPQGCTTDSKNKAREDKMGIEGDHGPEGAAVPYMDGWMDGWMDGETVLSSGAGRILVLGAITVTAPNINDELKKKSQNYLLNFLYFISII
jgi:hypothetical protein